MSAADPALQAAFEALCADGFQRGDAEFRHQHVVDAHGAQTARADGPPIAAVFALMGLCLHLEHGWNGRRVQDAHVRLARRPQAWPTLALPISARDGLDARDALAAAPGAERDALVRRWCGQVWASHAANQDAIRAWLRERGVLGGD